MLSEKMKCPYHVPIPDCPYNIKSVRSAEFWYWIDMNGYLVNVRLLLVLRREKEDIKKCLSLKALRNKDRMDVETAIEIHREKVQRVIPDQRKSSTLVPELEFKHWKKNGANILKCPSGVSFSAKYSKLFVTDRLLHSVYMVDMHCPSNVTLITGGVEQGYANGIGRKAKFNNPSGIVAHGDQLYICDQGNGRIRVVDVASLFCHFSQIPQHGEESENDKEECAVRRVHKVEVRDLSLSFEGDEVSCLESPYAICASVKQQFQLYISDIWQHKIFVISSISQDEENFGGHIRKVRCFGRSSVLTSLAVTQDEQYLLVGDCNENASKIHICCLDNLEETRSISNISCPMGIVVTEERTVFVSSCKEHGLYCAQQDEIVLDTGALTLACGSTRPGHRDGINSEWNMHSALCAYLNTVFVCDIGNKAVRILTSAKKLLPLQKEMAKYANVFRLDKEALQKDLPVTFDEHLKHVQEVNSFFSEQEQQAFERTGKLNTNGPDMTVARCTRQSFQIVLDSLTSLSNTLTEIGMDHLLDSIRFESLTTLGVECFFKAMRADHDMPTIAGYAYKRARCVKDDIMRIYQKRFSYFTGPNSFYPEKNCQE